MDNKYQYYDLFSLKGELPLANNEITYPYVTIDNNLDSVIINFFISDSEKNKSVYQRKGDSFERKYTDKREMTSSLYHEIIKNDSIFTLNYKAAEHNHLGSVSTFSSNILTTYVIREEVNDNVSFDSALAYLETKNISKLYAIHTTKFIETQDSILVLYKFQDILEPNYSKEIKFSFERNNKSLTWWLIYKWKYYSSSLLINEDKIRSIKPE